MNQTRQQSPGPVLGAIVMFCGSLWTFVWLLMRH